MTTLNDASRQHLNAAYLKITEHAANGFDDYQRGIAHAAELAADLGISKTEQEADYQAALARAEARG